MDKQEQLVFEKNSFLQKELAKRNRELEIEASLERVRQKAMATRASEELKEVVKTLFEELTHLDINLQACLIATFDPVTCDQKSWIIHGKTNEPYSFLIPYNDQPFYQEMLKAWKERNANWSYILEDEQKNNWENFLFNDTEFRLLPKEVKEEMHKPKKVFFAASYYPYGAIQASSPELLSKASIDILQRFSKVFDSCYTRFLDLKKAESQAREAQIQLALERVRAKSLAMHHSSELQEVVNIVAQQLHNMNIDMNGGVFICINKEVDKDAPLWAAAGVADYVQKVVVPNSVIPIISRLRDAIKKGNNFLQEEFSNKEKKEFFRNLFTHEPWSTLSEERKKELLSRPGGYTRSVVVMQYTSIAMINHNGKRFSEDENEILKRFGNVFEQSYTRFLDLQKAEAQARESQIQLALERVRARTMAMQKSDELSETVFVLFQQFKELGENPDQATIGVMNEDEKVIEYWVTMYGQPINKVFKFPIDEPNVTNKIYKAWKENKKSLVIDLTGKALTEFMAYRAGKGGAAVNPDEKRRTINVAFFSKGLLNVQSNEERSEESIKLLERFASVFEQTYTRFLDLKKAESQAREAQIQLALERVRAKTMAMQKPAGFVDVINIIGEQFLDLGFDFDWVNFSANGLDVSKAIDIWNFVVVPGLYQGATRITIPFFEHPVFKKAEDSINEYRTSGNSFTVVLLDKKDKDSFLDHLFTNTIYKDLPEEAKASQYDGEVYQTINVVLKDTWLSVGKYDAKPFTDEQAAIIKRLATAFGQAYTRFLDLQKAEAQAREAQIEAALEKVRSRSLAMHKSDELREVIVVVFEKLKELGLVFENAGIQLFVEKSKDILQWVAAPDLLSKPILVNLPYEEKELNASEIVRDIWLAKEKNKNIFNKSYSLIEKNKFFKYAGRHNSLQIPQQVRDIQLQAPGYTYNLVAEKHAAVWLDTYSFQNISVEDFNVLKRVAKVFEQAYTRFLDLQKAEAQAREAQIEAGLERVRSRAMAMQSSEELAPLIGTVFTELTRLDLALTRCVIWIFDPETNGATWWMANSEDAQNPISCFLPYNAYEPYLVFLEQWEKRANKFQYELSGTIKKDWDDYLFSKTGLSRLPPVVIEGMKAPERVFLTASFNNFGAMNAATLAPLSEQDLDILLRFARVFDLTYTRFNDLKQAEAQAREAQIQLALERVRARTMAMFKSEELAETAGLLFQQIHSLGLPLISCGYNIWEENDKVCDAYMSDAGGFIHSPFKIPLTQSPVFIHFYNSRQKKEKFYTEQLNGEVLASHYKYMLTLPGFASIADNFLKAGFRLPEFQVNNVANFSHGNLIFITSKEVPEAEDIFMRFASVFDQSYTRFLDLQKAEAQAREAHIEAALEKVRSRTMAMRKSDELSEVAILLFNQVKSLGIKTWTTGFNVWSDNNNYYTDYITSPQGGFIEPYTIDATHFAAFAEISHARKTGEEFFVSYLEGDILKQTYLELAKFGDRRQYEIMLEGGFDFPSRQFNHFVFGSKVSLMFITYEPVPEAHDIFKRFGKVFEQTYTRFLDLQKAEAQAREAQIEAALERVRAKAMAMHNSNDVSVAASMVFTELRKLGIDPIRCGVGLLNKESRKAQLYSATSTSAGDSLSLVGWVILSGHPVLENIYAAWLKNEDYYPELTGTQLKSYYENLLAGLSLPIVPNSETGEKQYGHFFSFPVGCLYTWSDRHYDDSEINILKRFAAIIDLTFRRYLDLQKAEANAKEAQIEASLERIRGKAMAMHTTQDLSDTIGAFYHELQSFSLTPIRCGVGLLEKEERIGELYTWYTTDKGKSLELIGRLKMEGHPVLNKVYEYWLAQKEYHPVLRGNEIKEYYKVLRPQMDFPDNGYDEVQFGYFFFFPEGGVYAWMEKQMQENELQIYRRFTSVLSLTYKRYRDLQKAEANAKEAVKQSALDRIRADIASMRTTKDLERITPLIWNELTILGVPFIRCGVFIMDEAEELIHSFLSTPEGKAIAAFQLPYHSAGELSNVLLHWRKHQVFKNHWNEEQFTNWTKSLVEQGAITSEEIYSTAHRPVNLNLHFLPFLQGMLYVGSEEPLTTGEIQLAQSLADAFSTAYARYEDFNKLEAAKAQIEKTLNDLKQAQAQLVQSEKMASLGELTAGIAHEIQNPLNFVNNFSDVNSELIAEMEVELQNGNVEEAISIANDIKENEEKINHHGKRADAIVKGMLQHSRKSSGQKEPTDINALADEYLRLSYHGLRAKDKTFNADFKTDFDESIGKINIIPQDIGRVLLNLFNNAFYAVNEQKKSNLISYQPTVFVGTQECDGKIQITVRDNGNGIPQKIVDKIFQPFFTTKPTGEGTGLGLSLSYDIIKVHGGEIKVESKEGEGTDFIIQLPIHS